MKRLIYILIALPLSVMLNAQKNLSLYEYWIDRDYDNRQERYLSQTEENIAFSIDTQNLEEGIHDVSLHIKDNEGNWSETVCSYYYVTRYRRLEGSRVTTCEYWLDDEYALRRQQTVTGDKVALAVDMSAMQAGMHTLSLRMKDDNGNATATVRSYIYVRTAPETISGDVVECEYWLDDEYALRRQQTVTGDKVALAVDMSAMQAGMHTLSLRMKDDNGNATATVRSYVYVRTAPETVSGDVVECEYWTDDDSSAKKVVAVSGENIAMSIDASSLSFGKHTLSLRVKNAQGNYSGVITDSFYKLPVEEESGTPVTCEYWIDQDFANRKEVPVTGGAVVFTVDASDSLDGMHMLSWRIRDDKGKYGGLNSSMYFKHTTVAPAEDITWYQYWWNDRADMAVRNDVSSNGIFTLEDIVEVPDYVSETRGLETGTAEFHILFGNDKGIISNIITETVTDKIPPTSHMNPLPSTQETSRQELSWSGTDKWSGVMDYTVYVYNDMEEQFVPYVENTSDTVITYYCSQKDHVVKFFVIARDSMGNVEPMKTEAETEVRFMYVDVYPPTTELQASSGTVNVGEAVELTWRSIDDSNDIAVTNIYYSEDDGPLILWKTVAGESTATFKGKAGSTYHFIVTACDTEGNLEKPNIAKAVKVHFNN